MKQVPTGSAMQSRCGGLNVLTSSEVNIDLLTPKPPPLHGGLGRGGLILVQTLPDWHQISMYTSTHTLQKEEFRLNSQFIW
jgi:hypothetical protein